MRDDHGPPGPRAPIEITDPLDPRIAAFRDIRERDLTGRQGRFIAEGAVVLAMLAAAHKARGASGGFQAESLLILKNKLAGIAGILGEFPADVPVYTAEAAVLDAIAGFPLHRGILGLGRRLAEGGPDGDIDGLLAGLPASSLVLAGCGIANHDNLGAMFRNAAAFSADAVFLDAACCDPLYRKALRVSVGSVLSVPYRRGGEAVAMLEGLSAAGFAIWSLSPDGETELRDIAPAARMALVIGTEGAGLSETVLARFHTARIAQSPRLDSLNAATAAGLALYRMATAMRRL